MEKVSIIIPAYNVERFIGECIKSVLAQTYENIEVVVVDDGSSDGTADAVSEIAATDPRVKLIRNGRGGVSIARNTALNNATGDFIMSVDSDDVIEPDMIETLYKKYKETGADVVACGLIYMTEEGDFICKKAPPVERILSGRDALVGRDTEVGINAMMASPCAKLAKREVYEGKRYREGIIYEDMHLMPYLYYDLEKFVIITYCGYYYRQRHGSIMHTKEDERIYKISFEVFSDHAEFYHSKGDTELEYLSRRNAADKILMACREGTIPDGLERYSENEFKKHYKFIVKHAPSAKERLKFRLFRYLGIKGYRLIRKKV